MSSFSQWLSAKIHTGWCYPKSTRLTDKPHALPASQTKESSNNMTTEEHTVQPHSINCVDILSASSRWLWRLSPLWRRVALQLQRERVDGGVPHAEGPRVPQLLCAERSAVRGGVWQHRALRSRSGLLGGLTAHAARDGQLLHHHVQRAPVCYRLSDRGGHHDHPVLWRRHQPLVHGQLRTAAAVVLHTQNCDPQKPHLLHQVSCTPKPDLYTFI